MRHLQHPLNPLRPLLPILVWLLALLPAGALASIPRNTFTPPALPLATVQSANPVAADEGAGKKLLKGGAPEGSAKVIKATQCSVAGTPVATPDGWKNIEDIKEGDVVYAFNETTG